MGAGAATCIFCFEAKRMNREDVFPTSIGGRFWIDRVCMDCNSRMGAEVDCLLTDHPLALMMRQRYGITGKSGKIPPVLREGTMEVADGEGGTREVKVHMKSDPATGSLVPSIIPSIIEKAIGDDGTRTFSGVFATEAEARKWLQRELQRGGLTPATDADFQELFQRMKQPQTAENPRVNFEQRIDTISIRRPLLKIAYELAWFWLGDAWLQDPVAKKIRKVMRASASGTLPIRGEISLFGSAQVQGLVKNMHIEPHEHLGLVMRTGGRLALFVTAFNTFCSTTLVSDQPERYDIDDYAGRYLLIDARTGSDKRGPLSDLIRLTLDRASRS